MNKEKLSNKALFVVDVQREFCNTDEELSLEEDIIQYIEEHSIEYAEIISASFTNKKDSIFRKLRHYDGCMTPESQEVDILIRNKSSLEVTHSNYSCVDYKVIEVLNNSGVKTVEVVGLDTDSCVMATALDLFKAGYKVLINQRLVFSSGGQEIHEAAIKCLRRQLGKDSMVNLY